MDAMLRGVMDWALSDTSGLAWAIAAIAVLGAANGVRLSLGGASRAARRPRRRG